MFCFNPCILRVRALKPGRSLGSLLWSQRLWRKGVQNRTQVSLLPIQALFTSLPKSSPPLPRPMQCSSQLLKRALSTEAPGSRKAERLLSFCFSHFPFLSYIEDRTLVCVCVWVCVWVCTRTRAQSCLRLCNRMECNPPGSSVYGISQARILERVAISFSRGSSWLRYRIHISCIACIGRWILYHLCHLW